jgi:hypothetical protein
MPEWEHSFDSNAIRPLVGQVVHTVVELVDPGARDLLGSLAAGVGRTHRPR